MPKSVNTINQSDINESMNHVIIAGALDSAPSYSHEYDGIKFYSIRIRVFRTNGNKYDVLHAFVPEANLLINDVLLDKGVRVRIEGYVVQSELKSMSDVSIVVESITTIGPEVKDENLLCIGGTIHRIFDLRPINDSQKVVKPMILKHNFASGDKTRSLTIKISCWNNTAKLVDSRYKAGDRIFIRGQLESKAVRLDKDKDKEKKERKATIILHEASATVIMSIDQKEEQEQQE